MIYWNALTFETLRNTIKNSYNAALIQKKDIDSFFTASGQKPFTHRIIVSTCKEWSENAELSLIDQQPPVTKIDLIDLENSQIDWSKYQPSQPPALKEKKKLRRHQISAHASVLTGLKKNDRGKLIMACGTGKTFTSLKIAVQTVSICVSSPATFSEEPA